MSRSLQSTLLLGLALTTGCGEPAPGRATTAQPVAPEAPLATQLTWNTDAGSPVGTLGSVLHSCPIEHLAPPTSALPTARSEGVGPTGGSVNLLHFGIVGDTRPHNCDDTAGYPGAIIASIGDALRAAGAQFALDLGDHMYVCNDSLSEAQTQMSLFEAGPRHFGGTWFMTLGNHECMGPGATGDYCPADSQNANYRAFLGALAPISCAPYYAVDVQTSLGLTTFVFVADNAWDAQQQNWLERTLSKADLRASYTIVVRHHPQGTTTLAGNAAMMQTIRSHKFSLLLTGHAHHYQHETADQGRDVILGTGGAPLDAPGAFFGYALVDQQPDGTLRFTLYDLATGTPQDQFSVGPNR